MNLAFGVFSSTWSRSDVANHLFFTRIDGGAAMWFLPVIESELVNDKDASLNPMSWNVLLGALGTAAFPSETASPLFCSWEPKEPP